MDFSRKLFHEIVVEREGSSLTVVVAYEWLPDFCSHCQNIGHDVKACKRLYPRHETSAPKERIDKGKKQVPIKKATWAPISTNPSGIGSSLAFGAATIPEQVTAEKEPPQHSAAHVTTETEPVQVDLQLDTTLQNQGNEITEIEPPQHSVAHVTTETESVQVDLQPDTTLQNQGNEITNKTDATPVESQEDEILERTSDIPADIPIPVVIPTS